MNPHNPVNTSTGTPATPETLMREAFSVLDARSVEVSRSKVSRIARDYLRHVSDSGAPFEAWLLSALNLDWAQVIRYPDPTGEEAVGFVRPGASFRRGASR